MTSEFVIQLIRQALMMTFWLSLPLLMVGFTVGIVISLVQIVTSIQDNSFSTVPRLGAFLVAMLVSMPWLLQKMTGYTTSLFADLGRYAR